jgi:hypothetical protein
MPPFPLPLSFSPTLHVSLREVYTMYTHNAAAPPYHTFFHPISTPDFLFTQPQSTPHYNTIHSPRTRTPLVGLVFFSALCEF